MVIKAPVFKPSFSISSLRFCYIFLVLALPYSVLLPVSYILASFLVFYFLLCGFHPISMNLFEIMNNAEQVPLGVHLFLSSQGKPFQANRMADVGKGWFSYGKPHAVKTFAHCRIDLTLHSLSKSGFPLR